MCVQIKKPEIIVFAGPNGSGKTTVTKLAKVIEPYINADEIKRTNYCSADINVTRVESRAANGGHSVPENKIRSRYEKALALIPELVKVCDVFHIYDNSTLPFRIFKKRKSEYFYWQNEDWSKEKIQLLTGITL